VHYKGWVSLPHDYGFISNEQLAKFDFVNDGGWPPLPGVSRTILKQANMLTTQKVTGDAFFFTDGAHGASFEVCDFAYQLHLKKGGMPMSFSDGKALSLVLQHESNMEVKPAEENRNLNAKDAFGNIIVDPQGKPVKMCDYSDAIIDQNVKVALCKGGQVDCPATLKRLQLLVALFNKDILFEFKASLRERISKCVDKDGIRMPLSPSTNFYQSMQLSRRTSLSRRRWRQRQRKLQLRSANTAAVAAAVAAWRGMVAAAAAAAAAAAVVAAAATAAAVVAVTAAVVASPKVQ
jgi:hypothetical protein